MQSSITGKATVYQQLVQANIRKTINKVCITLPFVWVAFPYYYVIMTNIMICILIVGIVFTNSLWAHNWNLLKIPWLYYKLNIRINTNNSDSPKISLLPYFHSQRSYRSSLYHWILSYLNTHGPYFIFFQEAYLYLAGSSILETLCLGISYADTSKQINQCHAKFSRCIQSVPPDEAELPPTRGVLRKKLDVSKLLSVICLLG